MSLPAPNDEIKIATVTEWLEDYIRRCIWACKGTEDEKTLQALIAVYDNLARISIEEEKREDQNIYIAKTLRRFNLALKVTESGALIDLKDAAQRLTIKTAAPHPEMNQDQPDALLANDGPRPITGVSLGFLLQEESYRETLWTYTRLLFSATQFLICQIGTEEELHAQIEQLLQTPSIEEMQAKMPGDFYLKHALFSKNSAISTKSLKRVRQAFRRHNIAENDPLQDIVLRIVREMENRNSFEDGMQGGLTGTGMEIVKSVVGGLQNNGGQARMSRKNLGVLMTILEEVLHDSNQELNPEVENIVNVIKEGISDERPMTKQTISDLAAKAGLTPSQLSNYMTSLAGATLAPPSSK